VAMLWYLLRLHRALPRALVGGSASVLYEGIAAGLIGASVVALWFLAIDWIQGEPLRTPQLLGAAVLRQSDPLLAVALYSVVHGIAFMIFGIVGASVIAGAERQPLLAFALVILFTAFEVFAFGAIVIVASWILDELAGWTIFVGNLLAATAMLAYYFRRHRTLARRMTAAWAEED